MLLTEKLLLIPALLLGLASTEFVVNTPQPVLTAYIDPLFARGRANPKCTNTIFSADKSAYWVPAAFMTDPQTKNTIHN
jgi:hypothetical protein